MAFPANEFVIVSEHNPSLVLDIEGASHAQGGKLITWGYHGGPNQRFRFGTNGSIVNVGSNQVLDVEGGVASGRKIIQYAHHGGENQKWRIHRDGTISLQSNSGLVLDIEGGSNQQGGHVILYQRHGGKNQLWRLANVW